MIRESGMTQRYKEFSVRVIFSNYTRNCKIAAQRETPRPGGIEGLLLEGNRGAAPYDGVQASHGVGW